MSTIRSQPYSRQGRNNWDDIFGKKTQPVAECGPDEIADGFGSVWSKTCPTCKQQTMEVVRPGKVQCTNCG